MVQVSNIDDYRQQKKTQPPRSGVDRLLNDARLRLVETGTRNRLVHTPRGGKRARSLPIIEADADGLFQTLVRSNRAMRFLPADRKRDLALEDDPTGNFKHHPTSDAIPTVLKTTLDEEKLEKRLLAIYRDAKTAEEEQGINILFLAIGFLRWYEDDKSEVLREAPLVLAPVLLTRDLRRSTFELRCRDEDLTTNQAIQERLRTDFGIALPELPENEEWLPSKYFGAVKETITTKSRWSIDPSGVELGFYSFSKLLMIRDLEPAAWGEKSIVDHPLLRGLLAEGFNEEPPPFPENARLDKLFTPSDLVQVVDADSSQTIVIETIRTGRNLVVQGPPGTGKSQTITNIIAAAVHDGKSVLFVAEKMAALNVVHGRLQKVGLGPICLQLHSRGANKRLVLAQIEETLNYHATVPDPAVERVRLKELRDTLNTVDERMHAPVGDTGATAFQSLSRLVAAAEAGVASDPSLLSEAAAWSKGIHASVMQAASQLSEITAVAGPCFAHPYFGIQAVTLQPAELARLTQPLTELETSAAGLAGFVEDIARYLGLEQKASLLLCSSLVSILEIVDTIPPDAAEFAAAIAAQNPVRLREASEIGVAWADLKAAHAETFVDTAWDIPPAPLRLSLAVGLSFFGRFRSSYRHASKLLATLIKVPLPRTAQNRIALVDLLVAVERARDELKAEDAAMRAMLPIHWRGPKTDFVLLRTVSSAIHSLANQLVAPRVDSIIEIARRAIARDYIDELKRLSNALIQSGDGILLALKVSVHEAFQVEGRDQIPLRDVAAKVRVWRDTQSRFDEWRRLATADSRVRSLSAALADAFATGRVPPAAAKAVLDCTFAEAVWSKAVRAQPELTGFYGPAHDAIVDQFRGLETSHRRTTVEIVRGRHAEKMPRGNYGAMNTIRAEIARRRGHMAIRKLFKTAGPTLQRIKPVLLMSPISVAQFLPPNSVEFDLLVIDEASQVRPEDALGLVARTKQMVVVGDNKQLPPTSFFDRIVADDEEADPDETIEGVLGSAAKATDLESILALCEARGLSSSMLRWHYRSRHPSLIEVSNAEFYKQLIMPPAPRTDRASEGLVLRRVAGAYDRGGKRTNLIEAEAVANAVAAHAKTSADVSLGVVTFSTAQRDAIVDLLEIKRRSDAALDDLLREGKAEDVFVKNIENVQGDERDVILVSVGYGPRVASARLDSMAFGPVSADGGERRLNVLFTRARSRCEIFVSFASGDIDLGRSRGEGPRVLKRFLQYAESGVLEERVSTSEDADSPFEEAVAAFIESQGLKVDRQVGSVGFKIDLAVRHPDQQGRYMLAVECDGATYHSGLWARERDRLRQEILENMGWRFCRIWSTDWFYRRGETAQKLVAVLEAARSTVPNARKPASSSVVRGEEKRANESAPAPESRPPAYKLAEGVPVPFNIEPYEVTVADMARITRAIVEIEGPIHQDEIARRVTNLFGKSRTGSLISASVMRGLRSLRTSSALVEQDSFWMTQTQLDNPPVRDRSTAPQTLQRADMLSSLEIRAAAKIAERENGRLLGDEIAIAVTRLLGFKRTGPELRVAIMKAFEP